MAKGLRRISSIFLILMVGIAGGREGLTAEGARQGTEAQVKAAYLYNFSLFTKWPESSFPSPEAPFIIAVLGDDPFNHELEKIAASEKVGRRAISLVRKPKGSEIPDCHVLYISLSERNRLPEILAALKSRPVLTVSDAANFSRLGGCIRFTRVRNRIGLEISPGAASAAGLRISPDLLEIAELWPKDGKGTDE